MRSWREGWNGGDFKRRHTHKKVASGFWMTAGVKSLDSWLQGHSPFGSFELCLQLGCLENSKVQQVEESSGRKRGTFNIESILTIMSKPSVLLNWNDWHTITINYRHLLRLFTLVLDDWYSRSTKKSPEHGFNFWLGNLSVVESDISSQIALCR